MGQRWALFGLLSDDRPAAAPDWLAADLSPKGDRGRNFGRLKQARSRAILVGVAIFVAIHTYLVWGREATPSEAMQVAWTLSFSLFERLGILAIWRARGLPETRTPGPSEPFWASFRASWSRVSRPLLILMGIVFLTSVAYQTISPYYSSFSKSALMPG